MNLDEQMALDEYRKTGVCPTCESSDSARLDKLERVLPLLDPEFKSYIYPSGKTLLISIHYCQGGFDVRKFIDDIPEDQCTASS